MWHYETTTETFLIQMARPGEYELWLNHRLMGTYPNCEIAAHEACTCMMNWANGKKVQRHTLPTSIAEWKPGEPEGYEPE